MKKPSLWLALKGADVSLLGSEAWSLSTTQSPFTAENEENRTSFRFFSDFSGGLVVKNPPCYAGDMGLIQPIPIYWLKPRQNPHTWFQDLMKLRFLIPHCRKNSVRDKVIGEKWIDSD